MNVEDEVEEESIEDKSKKSKISVKIRTMNSKASRLAAVEP